MDEMTEETRVLSEISQILSELFGIDPDNLTAETPREEIPAWDSLHHLNLVMDVERHFAIRLTEDRIAAVGNVGDLVACVITALQEQRRS